MKDLNTKNSRLALSTSIGSALEYFDFVVFMMMTPYIREVFFPNSGELASKIETLSIFAVAYLMRPIGGIIFGHLGDKYGRKSCFIYSIILMACATLCIGFLPGYATLGSVGAMLLCLFRMVQGLAQGGELPGALTFINEHSAQEDRGWKTGLIIMGVGIGAMFSSLISYLLMSNFSHQQMLQFGWRIPFFIGGIVGTVGYYIRKSMTETPQFLQQKMVAKMPFVELVTKYPQQLLYGVMIILFAACFIIFALFLPTYVHQYFQYETKQVMKALTWSVAWSSMLIPIFGKLTDRMQMPRTKILFYTASTMVFSVYFLFHLLAFGTTFALYLFMFTYQTVIAIMTASYPVMLADIFPTQVRYSGIAFCYNVAFSLAGFIPVVATMILHSTGWSYSVTILFMVLALFTVFATRKSESQPSR